MLVTILEATVQWSLVVGVATLVYFTAVTSQGVFTLHSLRYRSDFVFLFTVVGAAGLAAIGAIRSGAIDLRREDRALYFGLALYLVASFVATGYSLWFGGLDFDLTGIANSARALLTTALFVTAYHLLQHNQALYRRVALAFLLPPLLPVLAGILFVSGPLSHYAAFRCVGSHALFSWGERFQGFTSNPLQFFVNATVALAFVWVVVLGDVERSRPTGVVAGLLYSGALLCFALWTQARGGALSLLPMLGLGIFATGFHRKHSTARWIRGGMLAAILVVATWLTLPVEAKQGLLLRFDQGEASLPASSPNGRVSFGSPRSEALFGACAIGAQEHGEQARAVSPQSGPTVAQATSPQLSNSSPPLQAGDALADASSGGDQRLPIWRYYTRVAFAHPFGVGFNYAQRFYYSTRNQSHVTEHNAFLRVWMYGGFPAEVGLLLVLWIVCRSAWTVIAGRTTQSTPTYRIGAITALAGLSMLTLLGDLTFTDFTIWILMGMIVAQPAPASAVLS